ncbi:hypothetical protein VW23_016090 [Devosia insulae DS-56]|uniref:VOC domain-containing protein n=1 Tax=Devosia insulae DS-56 TaxID=1116389 RepID=A0A1E5XSA0_9HYPH|nr:VOC family protein [Devosia insulae]OEO31481.1 hypothetical protein VW23_016090 [Devosia insulae DS-56]
MQFNHANFAVADVRAAAEFFTRHFDFAVVGKAHDNFVVLAGEGGFVLNFMATGRAEASYHKNFHIGFFVGSVAEVRLKHAELVAAAYGPGEVQQFSRGGSRTTTFYCTAPGDFLVEVATTAAD